MQQFMTFVIHHWVLWSLAAVLLLAFFWLELQDQLQGGSNLRPQQLVDMMNHNKSIVIDVRDSNAFKEGHIIGAQNIPGDQFEKRLNKPQMYKNQSIVLVCTNGVQSSKMLKVLRQKGFEKVYQLQGGINAWRAASLPVVKGD